MKIGMLTGGGDCPGLNPAISGAVLRCLDYGDEVIGFTQGWKGLVEGNTEPLTLERVEGIIDQGGTILRSSRTNPFAAGKEDQLKGVLANIEKFQLDALIALGGEDTLGVASKLFTQYGVKTVGVPKTMDNDLDKTDYTFGFDSAASVALEALDRLRDTARSHDRVIVVEIMGRHAGWTALWAGVGGGADWILIPEVAADMDAMCAHLQAMYARGKTLRPGSRQRRRGDCRRAEARRCAARCIWAPSTRRSRHRPRHRQRDREADRHPHARCRARPHRPRRLADPV